MCAKSSGRLPVEERKLIVPNANFKLTLTYRNGIEASIGSNTFVQAENKLSLSHEGLVPEKEWYAMCQQGWNTVIKDYLFNFIAHDKSHL